MGRWLIPRRYANTEAPIVMCIVNINQTIDPTLIHNKHHILYATSNLIHITNKIRQTICYNLITWYMLYVSVFIKRMRRGEVRDFDPRTFSPWYNAHTTRPMAIHWLCHDEFHFNLAAKVCGSKRARGPWPMTPKKLF